ncbi:MAG: hypothetical protein PHY92_04455 [Alphaproteobacteria bacterium]|nr:hypothetical protein [Alphaproteobacteria bacterium]
MPEDILDIYRMLAVKNEPEMSDEVFTKCLFDTTVQKANAIVKVPCLLDGEGARDFIKYYCAARMKIYDAGANAPAALSPLVYRFQLKFEDSNTAVRSIYLGRPDLDAVIACARAVVACTAMPAAPKPVSGPSQSLGTAAPVV